jgi:ABC-2 type transport system permease protein
MRNLVAVELARFRTRRAITLLVLLAALLAAFVAFETAWGSRPPSSQELATAQANADIEAKRAGLETDLAQCLKDATSDVEGVPGAEQCREMYAPNRDSYLPREALDLRGTLKGNGIGVAVLVIGLIIIAGSTFAGADWSSGSMRNQVLFEPRRSRVWGAKAIAVTLSSGLVALVVLGGFWLSLYLVAVDREVPHGSGVVSDVGWHLLRAVVLAMAAGLGAFALTTIFRASFATLSVLFAYSVGGEIVFALLPIDGVARWSLGNNVFGWLETNLTFYDPTTKCIEDSSCNGVQHISHLDAGLYLLVLLVVAVAASWVSFRRRDI